MDLINLFDRAIVKSRFVFFLCFGFALSIALPSFAKQRPQVALVLSGGGARGGSHIGVLRVLEREGIPIEWNAILLLLALAFSVPAASTPDVDSPPPGHRIHRSIPPPGARTHVVIPGERFRASGLKRWFYGSNYRDLWTTPIEVAVLDPGRVGGGLTPLRTGGFGQSISLHFTGKDGRRYTVRSLDKDATRRVPDIVVDTAVGEVLQDLISAMLPTAALVVDPLMEATGILYSKHTLVVIPDDLRLGEYRARFAGLIGLLQEHPSEGPDNSPGFAGSRKVSGTENMQDDLEDDPCDRVNARAFLKARLMDFLIGDKDRHHGQWRWAHWGASGTTRGTIPRTLLVVS